MAIRFAHEDGPRLRVAVVGCGNHAYRSIFPCFDYLAAELTAVCDVDLDRARKYAAHFGAPVAFGSLAELLAARVAEAVLLVAGPKQHPELACEALAAGLHVWMEKPPAPDAAGVRRMIAARDRSGRNVAVGFKKVFMPATRRMVEAVQGGSYGSLRTVAGRFPLGIPPDGPRVLRDGEANNWLNNGVHPLSFFIHLCGRPERLTFHAAPRGGGFVLMEFPGGAVGCLHDAAGAARSGSMERYEVVCDKGHMICENNTHLTLYRPGAPFDYARGCDFTALDDGAAALVFEPQHTLSTLYNKALFLQGFAQELDYFVTACLEGKPIAAGTLEQAQAVMECYEAGLLSQGRPVRLDDLPALKADAGVRA